MVYSSTCDCNDALANADLGVYGLHCYDYIVLFEGTEPFEGKLVNYDDVTGTDGGFHGDSVRAADRDHVFLNHVVSGDHWNHPKVS